MQKNNLLNNYNKETELAPSLDSNHFNKDTQPDTNPKEEYSTLFKKLSINFSEIDFKKDIVLYSTLIFYNVIAIIFGFIEKRFDAIASIMVINYITLFISTKSFKLENNRYTDVSILNTCTSLNMFFKSVLKDKELEYAEYIKYSVVLYFISSFISFVPSFRYLIVISFAMLICSFVIAFSNKDGEIVKESLLVIQKYLPIMLVLSFMMGINFYNINALNFTGYIGWFILYKLYQILIDYDFNKIEKEV